jgi:AcrR family transcriptional regulator
MTKLSFKERERQRREREILRTAARLIRERGYANLNMDDIADEVGVSKPTLYQHFKSKDDMVAYTLLEACDTMEHYINESEGGSALERLEKIMRHMLEGYLDPEHFSPTLMQVSGMEVFHTHEGFIRRRTEVGRQLFALVEQAQRDGEIAADIPVYVISAAIFSLMGIMQEMDFERQADSQVIADGIMKLFRRGIAAPTTDQPDR